MKDLKSDKGEEERFTLFHKDYDSACLGERQHYSLVESRDSLYLQHPALPSQTFVLLYNLGWIIILTKVYQIQEYLLRKITLHTKKQDRIKSIEDGGGHEGSNPVWGRFKPYLG